MNKSILTVIFTAVLAVIAAFFTGCSKSSESVKPENTNQSVSNTVIVSNSASPNAMPVPSINGTNSGPVAVNKAKLPASPMKEPTPQIGTGAGDLSLFTQARGALSSDKDLIDKVIIEVKEGNVVLSGKVSSEAQKNKAAQLVQTVKGIKSLKNNLQVGS